MAEVSAVDLPSKRENSIVPFPKERISSGEGTLELYFKGLETSDGIPYDKLPEQFTSVGIEHYLSWLAQLTNTDPKHKERAAYLHLVTNGGIIYPSNPTVGRTLEVNNAIASRNPDKFFPFMRTHSHPNGSSFSPQDLKRALSTKYFIAEGLGTQNENFILLRTDESEFDEPQAVNEKMDDNSREIREQANKLLTVLDSSVSEGSMPKEVADHLQAVILLADIDEFGTDFASYYLTMANSLFAANEYKLGFYVSRKDGNFKRVMQEDLARTLLRKREIINEALDKLIKK